MLYIDPAPWGHVAEWLRNGLQNRVHQFNSGRGLHKDNQLLVWNYKEITLGTLAAVVEPLRSDSGLQKSVAGHCHRQKPDRLAARNMHGKIRPAERPIAVLSTERSPPNLTAALTRLRRSFLDGTR
jgi:hypothetical protein